MRLDRFLCEMNIGSRSEVKEWIRRRQVSVNGQVAARPDSKVDENSDTVVFQGRTLCYKKYVYYMLNKPEGVISATEDRTERTVLDLLLPRLDQDVRKKDIFPVGRLDRDTTGLLILTNDGALAHELLSPAKHVDKTYLVVLRKELTAGEQELLEQGVEIGERNPTKPAKVERCPEDPCRILLTIQEGKYHQVKRMLQAVGNEVVRLERVAFGGIELDRALEPGDFRELTEDEIKILRQNRSK